VLTVVMGADVAVAGEACPPASETSAILPSTWIVPALSLVTPV